MATMPLTTNCEAAFNYGSGDMIGALTAAVKLHAAILPETNC